MNNPDGFEQTYHLTCSLKVIRKGFRDTDSKGNSSNQEADLYLLKIEEGTQKNRFLDAWFSELHVDKTPEVIGVFHHPVGRPGRLAILPSGKHISEPHLLIMSMEVESVIKGFLRSLSTKPEDVRLKVDIQPASMEMTEFEDY